MKPARVRIVHLVAGARPNFMKIAPLYHELVKQSWARVQLVHTGQHYDENMSGAFLRELALPQPDYSLGVGSGSHAEQTAKVMMAYEKICLTQRPDLAVVVGDVNSTLACALTAAKLEIPVAHLEAGLRSYDRSMPEEINRLVADSVCDLLWTPSLDANENLAREGIPSQRIEFVGNIMIDSLELQRGAIEQSDTLAKLGLKESDYILVTMHRPSNVDVRAEATHLVQSLIELGKRLTVVLPLHPRSRKNFEQWGLLSKLSESRGVRVIEPLSYHHFMRLLFGARLVVTDSGGVQEETTYLGIPCITTRPNTERPITISQGTNRLSDFASLIKNAEEVLKGVRSATKPKIEFWDGRTAARVVSSIRRFLSVEDACSA